MMSDDRYDALFHAESADGRRIIRLRRPAVLSVLEDPFVPDRASLADVDARWRALCAENDAYFDGDCYHVFGVHRNGHGGAVVHVARSSYRFYAVQDDGFDLGMRGLGVKGVVEREGQLLFGRRSSNVAFLPNQWELAPGGAVEPGDDPAQTVMAELREETGLEPGDDPVAEAILYDPSVRTWEILHRLRNVQGEPRPTDEYPELAWAAPTAPPGPLTPIARRILESCT